MFTDISLEYDSSKIQFQDFDLKGVLDEINTVAFIERIPPDGELEEVVNVNKILPKEVWKQNCHGVTSELIKYRSDLQMVYGYLMIGKVPINLTPPYLVVDEFSNLMIKHNEEKGLKSEANRIRGNTWEMKIDEENNQVMLRLRHHSVVQDERGNLIECLYDKYPLNSEKKYEYGYVFLPHASAEFLANKSAISPCNLVISCSM
ncbi:hypothetical protein VB780_06895 [Leptolyngbya sp. CCNP1308]|uniref:hypothetical protein n=1 Tax=Leptolyngbya sp. CCNP1308 TaxID=3110255 RepID=UPI002B201C17|nr:hypothetical protein [Leptolyngbya sp. CCNP1308]MEA5448287.1 hypothetical protein [Leptolyngbya sp. CCNP1308]